MLLEKYKKIIFEKGLAHSQENAELLADTLYQLAFVAVNHYLSKRRQNYI